MIPVNATQFSFSDQLVNAAEEVTVLAAQGADTVIHVTNVYFSVILAATGAGVGKFAVEDGSGGERFVEESVETIVNGRTLDFGDWGFELTPNTACVATVDGATTNEATVRVTVTGWVSGNIGGF